MKCPKCGSDNTQYVTNNIQRGFSGSNACCGYILAGPLGLLCGFCGDSTYTQEYWICQSCGHKFSKSDSESANMQEDDALKVILEAGEDTFNNIDAIVKDAQEKHDMAFNLYHQQREKELRENPEMIRSSKIIKILTVAAVILFFGAALFISDSDLGIVLFIPSVAAAVPAVYMYFQQTDNHGSDELLKLLKDTQDTKGPLDKYKRIKMAADLLKSRNITPDFVNKTSMQISNGPTAQTQQIVYVQQPAQNDDRQPDEDNVEKITCPNCGTVYDSDFPRCPNCRHSR